MSNPEHFDQDGHVLMLHSPTGKLIPVPFDPRRDVADAVSPIAADTPPNELTCKYKGSLCLQPRVRKRNGELHNLCALHRERANANQGRFDSKLKQRRQQDQDDDGPDTSDLPEPIQNPGSSPTPPINKWEADLLLKTIQDSG